MQMEQLGQLVPQTSVHESAAHAPNEHRLPLQFRTRSQSQLQAPQIPQEAVPQLMPVVSRAQLAVSVSVPLPALQVPPPQAYVVVGRVRLPALVQVEP